MKLIVLSAQYPFVLLLIGDLFLNVQFNVKNVKIENKNEDTSK